MRHYPLLKPHPKYGIGYPNRLVESLKPTLGGSIGIPFLHFFAMNPTCHPFPSHPGNEIRSTAQAVPSWGTGRAESDWALAAAKGSRRVLQEDPAAWKMGSQTIKMGNQWVFIVGTW